MKIAYLITVIVVIVTLIWVGAQLRSDLNEITYPKDRPGYQIQAYDDSTVIWSGDRRVGVVMVGECDKLDEIIEKDNE